MFVNVIKSYRNTVAICDSDLIGKYFEEDNLQLEVKENFYKGEEKSEEEASKIIEDMMREDATFNIVGENSVKLALKLGVVKEEAVGKISGVPFVLILL